MKGGLEMTIPTFEDTYTQFESDFVRDQVTLLHNAYEVAADRFRKHQENMKKYFDASKCNNAHFAVGSLVMIKNNSHKPGGSHKFSKKNYRSFYCGEETITTQLQITLGKIPYVC